MKVEFVLNPTGPFNLSYNPGDVVDFENDFAKKLIETGYAVQAKEETDLVGDNTNQTQTSESAQHAGAEKAVINKGKKRG